MMQLLQGDAIECCRLKPAPYPVVSCSQKSLSTFFLFGHASPSFAFWAVDPWRVDHAYA